METVLEAKTSIDVPVELPAPSVESGGFPWCGVGIGVGVVVLAAVQTDDVLPSIERLEKSIDDIKGDITQLFDRLSDLAEDVDELRKKS